MLGFVTNQAKMGRAVVWIERWSFAKKLKIIIYEMDILHDCFADSSKPSPGKKP